MERGLKAEWKEVNFIFFKGKGNGYLDSKLFMMENG